MCTEAKVILYKNEELGCEESQRLGLGIKRKNSLKWMKRKQTITKWI